MLNKKSIDAAHSSTFSHSFRKPLIDSYSFALIPGFIRNVFSENKDDNFLTQHTFQNISGEFDNVILFLVDGFGWNIFEQYASSFPFLKRFFTKGSVSVLTAQYPSTTAVQLTTIHSSLPVSEHGICEWNMYEPLVDDIISPLPFSYSRDKKARNTLEGKVDAKDIFPSKTIYQNLNNIDVASFIIQSGDFTPSPFLNCVGDGANVFPYKTFAEGLTYATDIVSNKKRTYTYFYFSGIDTMLHTHGPNSREARAEVTMFFTTLEEVFIKNLRVASHNKTLLILTADHGHATIDPSTTIYLNKQFPVIEKWIKRNREGKLLVPGGNCRNMYLYTNAEDTHKVKKLLEVELKGRAEVYDKQSLIQSGVFGSKPSNQLLDRLGDIIILPYNGESVWWYEEGVFEQKYYGHHGGLTPEEMDIPFLLLPT